MRVSECMCVCVWMCACFKGRHDKDQGYRTFRGTYKALDVGQGVGRVFASLTLSSEKKNRGGGNRGLLYPKQEGAPSLQKRRLSRHHTGDHPPRRASRNGKTEG